jgi:hypothetical protein
MSFGIWLSLIFLVLIITHMVTWPIWVIFVPLGTELLIDLIIVAVFLFFKLTD